MPQLGITALEYIISKGGNIALKTAKFGSGGAKKKSYSSYGANIYTVTCSA